MITRVGDFGTAHYSDDETHRYALRVPLPGMLRPARTMVVIGLNPSTATEDKPDPTLRRCVRFAQREWCDVLVMLNLFSIRSTDPMALYLGGAVLSDDDTDLALGTYRNSDIVVAAWGVHGDHFPARVERVLELARPMFCWGFTKSGQPRHPLYLRNDTPLVEFRRP